jgi:hypothetical protein
MFPSLCLMGDMPGAIPRVESTLPLARTIYEVEAHVEAEVSRGEARSFFWQSLVNRQILDIPATNADNTLDCNLHEQCYYYQGGHCTQWCLVGIVLFVG